MSAAAQPGDDIDPGKQILLPSPPTSVASSHPKEVLPGPAPQVPSRQEVP